MGSRNIEVLKNLNNFDSVEFSDDTKALLLLTASLGRSQTTEYKPLTFAQWNRLRGWLDKNQQRPQKIFRDIKIIQEWIPQHRKNPSLEQVKFLLERGYALAEALSRWERAGIWVMTYLDDDYPHRVKERLGHQAPPLFFGIGHRTLLQNGGLAVVGSRQAPSKDIEYTKQLGTAASEHCVIISGGAKGVDMTAMNACLEAGGQVVGVLSNKLLRRSMDSSCRDYLQNGQLVFISQTDPEINLNRYDFVASAMNRNKYIYCLSDAAVVVHYGIKGGTISGAVENLNHSWVPLWVKSVLDFSESQIVDNQRKPNLILVQMQGAHVLSEHKTAAEHLKTILETIKLKQESNKLKIAPEHDSIQAAVILLTVRLNFDTSNQIEPLNIQEWKDLTEYLRNRKLTPAHLLDSSADTLLGELEKSTSILQSRVKKLLDKTRQERINQEIVLWIKENIHVFIRGDMDYPKVLKSRLQHDSPPVLFICGNAHLLNKKSRKIMVLGSAISINEMDKNYAETLGESLASHRCLLISTFKTQIEKIVVQSFLQHGGQCIMVLCGNLKKIATHFSFKKYVEKEKLAIVSASPPKGKFTSEDQRYDIAQGLSTDVLILCSGKKDIVSRFKKRCLKNRWTALYSKSTKKNGIEKSLIVGNKDETELMGENADKHIKQILLQT